MNLFYQKIKQKENGRDTYRAAPVVLRRSCSDLRECYGDEECDHDHVVHRVVRGADHHRLIFCSSVAERLRVEVERALVLVPVEEPGNDERDSSRERDTDQAMDESELDRLLDDGAPFVVALAEASFLGSHQERKHKHESEEEEGHHQSNRDMRGLGTICDRLDEHVATAAEKEVDPAPLKAWHFPQHDRDCNRQQDNTEYLDEHLDTKPLPHLPDELIVSPLGNERKCNAGNCEQNENDFADREQDFHPATSCFQFGMCNRATMTRSLRYCKYSILCHKSQEAARRRFLERIL